MNDRLSEHVLLLFFKHRCLRNHYITLGRSNERSS